MSLSVIASRTKFGMEALSVRVEVHISSGLPRFTLVGLPEKAVNESRERVRSAIINSGFIFPYRRVTVNLSPADMPKEGGGGLDLAIALGILAASKQLNTDKLTAYEFMGELALSGEVLPIRGFISAAIAATKDDRAIIFSKGNSEEASLLKKIRCYPAAFLYQVVAHLNGTQELSPLSPMPIANAPPPLLKIDDICGQQRAKRALVVAAAGRHNLLMNGPPGSGKTMLAQRLPALLPPLSDDEYLQVLSIHSVASRGFSLSPTKRQPPFRSPHHSATAAALVGGGSNPVPGEISLAHRGVLFLDELPEFARSVLEVLRQPLESGEINIARATKHINFPADFQLIAAMNPCPCGNLNHPRKECRCTPDRILAYRNKISAPLLDRIDLHVEVPPLNYEEGFGNLGKKRESKENNKHLVLCREISEARQTQLHRTAKLNSRLSVDELERYCPIKDIACQAMIKDSVERFGLSLRTVHRAIKVARTIADMDSKQQIGEQHLAEALSYRPLN